MNNNTKKLTYTAMMIAITAALSQVSIPIPISPVPVTLQTAAVILAGIILGPRQGAAALLGYLLLGCMGLPVFSQGKAGPGVLLGPTGGFLLGFIAAAFIIGWLLRRKDSLERAYTAVLAGIAVVYLFGIVHFAIVTSSSLSAAFMLAALPYLPLEAVKIFIFTPAALRVRTRLSESEGVV